MNKFSFKIKIIILVLLALGENIFAQNAKSSLLSYDNLSDSLKIELDKLSEIEKIKRLQDICWDLRYSNSVEALKAGQASIDLAIKHKQYENLAQGLSFIGVIFLHISDYEKANEYFLKALEISEKYNLKLQIGYSYNNLSHLFKYMNKIDKAYQNIWKSKKIMEEINDKRGLSYAYLRLSDLYISTQNWDSAYYYALESVKLRKEIKSKKLEARAMLNVGEALEGQKKFQKALDIYLSITDDIEEIGKIEIYIAKAYLNLQNYPKAIYYADQSFKKTVHHSLYQQLLDASKILHESNKALGNFSKALDFADLKFKYRDSLFTFERDRQVEILNYSYDLEKKEKENKELIERGKDKDKFIIVSIIALVLLLMGSVSLFISRKKIKNINSLLQEKNFEIQKQTDELHELNATKDKFFSIIAHDLKNPIGSFKNVTEFFKDHFKELDIDEQLDFIMTLSESSNQVYNLLENLLEWSRIQRGNITFTPTEFDLQFLVANCNKLLAQSSLAKKVTLNNLVPSNTYVYADINMITTVVRNLVSNSIKFTKENGQVKTLVIDDGSELLTICVEDNGIGMSASTINKLFRIDSNHTTLGTANEKGTGLGLILCKEFVEKNNGKMWVESTEGIGSKFYFTLPKR